MTYAEQDPEVWFVIGSLSFAVQWLVVEQPVLSLPQATEPATVPMVLSETFTVIGPMQLPKDTEADPPPKPLA